MAKAIQYSDQFGNTYSESYWRVVQINISIVDKNSLIVFYGYKDQATRSAGKQSIGQKTYTISGDVFDTLYATHLAPNGPNLMQLAYQHATSTLDTPSLENPEELVSFFEGGEDV